MILTCRKLPLKCMSHIRRYQVTVLGAATEVGQSISLLLRAEPAVTRLVVQDCQVQSPGVAMDLSHVPSGGGVVCCSGPDTLEKALSSADIVIAAGGSPRRPGYTKNSCFTSNVDFIMSIAPYIARTSPFPFVGIVTEPINTMVPIASEVMRNYGDFNPRKVFGLTGVDATRARSLYAMYTGLAAPQCYVPVIGGHSAATIVPLLSKANPKVELDEQDVKKLTSNIKKCDKIITVAKKGWSPSLGIACNVLDFVREVITTLDKTTSGKVHAYVENNDFGTAYFGGLLTIDNRGIREMQRYNDLSTYECQLLETCIDQIRKDIWKGQQILETA